MEEKVDRAEAEEGAVGAEEGPGEEGWAILKLQGQEGIACARIAVIEFPINQANLA